MNLTLKELLDQHKVVIPQIQRDYAQGRDSEIGLRKGFVKKIKQSLESESLPLNLDFIYGYTKKIGTEITAFIPLDGQQRLTTLWLIHWNLAPREIRTVNNEEVNFISEEAQQYLSGFTYQTRASSKRFCNALITKYLPKTKDITLSKMIKDASWYMASWNYDPTIISMLNMLDTIEENVFEKTVSWQNLVSGRRVTFDYIDIKSEDFKLTDELYIKMNSRGKPLTSFENFKAQFSDLLSSKNTDYRNEHIIFDKAQVSYQQYFAFKIDSVWMDLFWSYRSKTVLKTDICILNFIYFIAEVLYYKNSSDGNSIAFVKNFDSLSKVFSVKGNTLFLFNALDLLSDIKNIEQFFNDLFSNYKSNENCVALFEDRTTDLFLRAITDSNFDVKHKTLVYSILTYCIGTNSVFPDLRMTHFVRVIRNLLLLVRQVNAIKRIEYTSNLRMPNIVDYAKFIDGLVVLLAGNKDKDLSLIVGESNLAGFTKEIINAEKTKAELILKRPDIKESIFQLEDHPEIQGNISCFNLDCDNAKEKVIAFLEIWNIKNSSSLIIRAFLTVGDYSVITHDYTALGELWYFGSPGYWNRILTTYDKDERIKITEKLDQFLSAYINSEGQNSKERLKYLINNYKYSSKDWKSYFIKYNDLTSKANNRFNLFNWADKNGFNINNLGNSGTNPLLSYHLNPYLYTLKVKLSDLKELNLHWGRYSNEISNISVNDNIRIYSTDQGWELFEINDYLIPESIKDKYDLFPKPFSLGHSFLLESTENKDRIEIACDFVRDLVPE